MAERKQQPARAARSKKKPTTDNNDTEDDVQKKLDDVLGSDSGDDMDYTPNLASQSDEDDKKKEIVPGREPSTEFSDSDDMDYTPNLAQLSEDDDKKFKDNKVIGPEHNVSSNGDNVGAENGASSERDDNNRPDTKTKLKHKGKRNKRFYSRKAKPVVYVRDLKCMPTELKKHTDRLWPPGIERSTKKRVRDALREQYMQEVVRMIPGDDPEAACSLVSELLKRPEDFWRNRECSSYFHGVMRSSWNFEYEDVGIICVQVLERLITSKKLLVETILKVGKISNEWRWKKGGGKPCKFEWIPKTMISCAQILLAEGDIDGFTELFKDFRSNLRNADGERNLTLYRLVAAMLEKKKVDEDSDGLSLGGSSFGTSFTGKSAWAPPDQVINEVRKAMKEGGEVDWFMNLFAWYVLDERSADDVKDILTEYRDDNIDHLPAHQHLLNFLFQEYEDETELLLEELRKFSVLFPFDDNVLRYCQMQLKKDDDEDLEESFDSNEDDLQKKQENVDKQLEVFEITIKFLDYEMNVDNARCWELLAESLKYLHSNLADKTVISLKFEDRGDWWIDQNFSCFQKCETLILMKKGIVAAFLYGQQYSKYLDILELLECRARDIPSPSLDNVLKEMRSVTKVVSDPFLEPFQPEPPDKASLRWNFDEWKRIGQIKLNVEKERNKSFFN